MRFIKVQKTSLKEIGMRLMNAADEAEKNNQDVVVEIAHDLAFYFNPKDEKGGPITYGYEKENQKV